MTAAAASITLSEWETKGPADCAQLANRVLESDRGTLRLVDSLVKKRMLGLSEMRNGLDVRAFSYVGRIRVGDLLITILAKMREKSLVRLMRYADGVLRPHL